MNPFKHFKGRGGSLGSNVLTDTANMLTGWTYDGLTRSTGGGDPSGGTTGIVATDTAANVLHRFYFQPSVALAIGQRWLATLYFKPGTFTNGISFEMFDTGFSGMFVNSSGSIVTTTGGCSNAQVAAAGNGFFQCKWIYAPQAGVAPGGSFYVLNFGISGQLAYLGTVQNQTFWGPSLQLIYP